MNITIDRKVPPLPFQGNKAGGRTKFIEFLTDIEELSEWTFVDLFGGSFYLSYLIHKVYPKAKIICNDYDNYMERLKNIQKTNVLLDKIRIELKDCEKSKKVSDEVKAKIDEIINNETEYVDYLTLSAALLCSSHYTNDKETFLKRPYFNHPPPKNYTVEIEDYIEGIEFVSEHWQDLFDKYCEQSNVLFIADPPNIKANNWTLRDSLETLDILKFPYFAYFTSTKYGLTDIIDYARGEGVDLYNYYSFVIKSSKTNEDVILFNFDYPDDDDEEEEEECAEEETKNENNDNDN